MGCDRVSLRCFLGTFYISCSPPGHIALPSCSGFFPDSASTGGRIASPDSKISRWRWRGQTPFLASQAIFLAHPHPFTNSTAIQRAWSTQPLFTNTASPVRLVLPAQTQEPSWSLLRGRRGCHSWRDGPSSQAQWAGGYCSFHLQCELLSTSCFQLRIPSAIPRKTRMIPLASFLFLVVHKPSFLLCPLSINLSVPCLHFQFSLIRISLEPCFYSAFRWLCIVPWQIK